MFCYVLRDGIVSTLAASLLERAGGSGGSSVAVFQSRLGVWEPVSWSALASMAERIGNGLIAKGVQTGDVVAIIAADSIEFLAVEYAILGIGATALLIPTDFSPETTAALLGAHHANLAIAGDQEQFDKCVDASTPPATIVVIETRGLRALEMAGRPDRSSRATLSQLIDDAGAASSWRGGVAAVRADAPAVLITSIDGTNVTVSSISHAEMLSAGGSAVETMAITPVARLLAQRGFAEPAEQVLSVGATLVSGCSLAIGEGGPLASSELAQVAPTHLHVSPQWLGGIHADASRRLGETKGLKRLALGGGLPSPASGAGAAKLSPSRLIGLATTAAVFLFLLVSPSMNDWIRLIISFAIAIVGGLVYLRTPGATRSAIRRRYGLGTCRAVIGNAAHFSAGSVEFVDGLGVRVVAPVTPTAVKVGSISSAVLAGRLEAAK